MNTSPDDFSTEQIWRELHSRLRRFVAARIKADSDIDDVIQDVFLRIHANLEKLRNSDRLESWVFQIARNAVTDHFRKMRTVDTDVENVVAELNGDSRSLNENEEIAACLRPMIRRLPFEQQRALTMYELEGLSQQEVADGQSISLSGAKSRIQRGRKSIEAMLKACCEFQFDGRGNILDHEEKIADCCDEC